MIRSFLINTLIFLSINCHGFAQGRYLPSAAGEVVHHTYYSLSYIEDAEQAEWVYYELTEPMVSGAAARTDDFREDKRVTTTSAQLADYKGAGYDRGHLCPAGSMSHNHTAMSESFYMSNMSPQVPSFNRGGWKQLESTVRSWAVSDSLLYVITGPVLLEDMPTIGESRVAVPPYYYKVIYSPTKSEMIAFLMPNEKLTQPIASYATTVDQVESLTGIDFFCEMTEEQEYQMERSIDASRWEFTISSTPRKKASASSDEGEVAPTTCLGHTKSGKRCRNHTKNSNGHCHLHQDQAK